jgi:hypothetical protein
MKDLNRSLSLAVAIAFGALTLLGLLFVPALGNGLTGWVSFLAAAALLMGVLNLLTVHSRRLVKRNAYSGVLIFSMLTMFSLAIADSLGITTNGVGVAFAQVQAPLEASMASLLAFFLLFAGVRLLKRERSWRIILFVGTVILVLISQTPLPFVFGDVFGRLGDFVSAVIVGAGMRGILVGVALGIVAVCLRLLTGLERPYDK